MKEIYKGSKIKDNEVIEEIPKSYQNLLREKNGFISFDGGLHIRGACFTPKWHSLRQVWYGKHALCKLYPVLKQEDVPFGQDCLGDQFILRQEIVFKLYSETGDLETLDMDLELFLDSAQKNPVGFLSLQPLIEFQRQGQKLKPGQLLSVYPPFCCEESKQGISLKTIPMFERIQFLADFSKQINGVSDKTSIKITICD